METIKIKGFTIEFELLTPANFLGEAGGIPISIFIEKKPQTMYEKTMLALQTEEEKKKTNDKELEICKIIIENNLISINGEKPTIDNYSEIEIKKLANMVLSKSLKIFNKQIDISSDQAYFYDLMGKRYGKTPIECLYPNGGYTELDAYMFNRYILAKAIDRENQEAKKLEAKRRKESLRRKK